MKTDETTIKGMMKPYDDSEMEVHTVGNKLNRLGYNTTDRSVIEPFYYPELPALNQWNSVIVSGGVRLLLKKKNILENMGVYGKSSFSYRLLHNAYKIEMRGDSMRNTRQVTKTNHKEAIENDTKMN